MGEDISGRENEDELSQRDKSVAAHTKKRWAFRMYWQPRKGGERKQRGRGRKSMFA